MSALAILEELRARGARVSRRGDRLRIEPAAAVTPELLETVRVHKAELLPLVPSAEPADPEAPFVPFRITIERRDPVTGTERFVEAELRTLQRGVAILNDAFTSRATGVRYVRAVEAAADDIADTLARLERVGVHAVVTSVPPPPEVDR